MTVRTSDIRRVVLARFLSRAGSEAAFFVGLWGKAAFEMQAQAYQLAGLMFAVSMAMIVGSFMAGVLVDRYGPRKVLMVTEWAFVPAALAILLAQDLKSLAVLAAIWAFVGSPVQTAAASFAPYLTDEDDKLRKINSWIEGGSALSFAVGPAVGALLVRFAHVDWVFVLDAVTSLAAAIIVYRVKVTPPPRQGSTDIRAALSQTAEGLRTVYRRRGVRYYVLAGSIVWLAFGSFGALEPLFFRDVVGTGIESMSWMNAIFGAGFVTGAWLLPRLPKAVVSARGLALFVGLTGMGTVLYVGSPDLRIIAAGAFFWSMVIGTMEPLLKTLLHRDSPKAVVGRVMGVAEMHKRTGEIVPLAFAPALAATFGVQATLIGGGLLASVAALASLGEARAIDRIRAERPKPEVPLEGVSGDDPYVPHP